MSYFQKEKKQNIPDFHYFRIWKLPSIKSRTQTTICKPYSYAYTKSVCHHRSPSDWLNHIFIISKTQEYTHARVAIYIVLNPARYLRGISGIIMKAGFASPQNHARYIYDVFANSNEFHDLDISNSDDIKVVCSYIWRSTKIHDVEMTLLSTLTTVHLYGAPHMGLKKVRTCSAHVNICSAHLVCACRFGSSVANIAQCKIIMVPHVIFFVS